MANLIGIVHIRHLGIGSKSEGDYACFTLPTGKEYILYREGVYHASDDYFTQFDDKKVVVEGIIEEHTHYVCVQSVTEE